MSKADKDEIALRKREASRKEDASPPKVIVRRLPDAPSSTEAIVRKEDTLTQNALQNLEGHTFDTSEYVQIPALSPPKPQPREWWVNLCDRSDSDYDLAHVAHVRRDDYVHVVERAAYEAVCKERDAVAKNLSACEFNFDRLQEVHERVCKERDEWQHEALQSRESLSDICKERDFCKVQWEMTSERLTKERDALAAQLAECSELSLKAHNHAVGLLREKSERIAELEHQRDVHEKRANKFLDEAVKLGRALAEANECKHPGCCCVCGHTGKCPEDGPCAMGGALE